MKYTGIRPPASRKPPLVRWLRRHGRVVTFLGASIVILTFIVKEGLKEWEKDAVDKIAAAQSRFDLKDQLSQVTELLERNRYGDGYQGSFNIPIDDLVSAQAGHRSRWAYTRRMDLYNLGIVANTLSKRRAYQKRIAALNEKVSAVEREAWNSELEVSHRQFEMARVRLFPVTRRSDTAPTTLPTTEHAEDLLDRAVAATEQVMLFVPTIKADSDWFKLREEVLDTANTEREEKERLLTGFTWLSYILYGIGWTLGLGGRLFGVAGASVAE